MSSEQREKWNQRYAERGPNATAPCPWLTTVESLLPPAGTALDVAGGAGRHAVWLAQRGLTVTIADIAEAGLELARDAAATENLAISTVTVDLESESLPAGPWDVILNTSYLYRPLMTQFAEQGYKDVYSRYRKMSEEVIEREEVPLSYQPIVTRYFEAIRPRANEGENEE